MLAYYFFKYWKQGTVGFLISVVMGYFGILSFALLSVQEADRRMAIEAENQKLAAQLSITPATNQLLNKDIEQTNRIYKKSLGVYEQIQSLKGKEQDTSGLETLYAESVKNLSNEKEKEALDQLSKLESQIAQIKGILEPTISGTPVIGISPIPSSETPISPSLDPEALVATDAAAAENF